MWLLLVMPAEASLKMRGVNLGGWLVLEKWIKPSLFAQWDEYDPTAPRDEWGYCKALGKRECRQRLEQHWDTWVTEDIVEELAEAGITHLRVPLPWYMMGDIRDEPYVDGQWPYFARLCRWAQKNDIDVWVDLHAAPGSQNGFDNSGRMGNVSWSSNDENPQRTLDAIGALSRAIRVENLNVKGVGLLNEPASAVNYTTLLTYYDQAYEVVRQTLGDSVAVYIGDNFKPTDFNWFWIHDDDSVNTTNTYLDSHIYACFVDDLRAMTPREHIYQVCVFERSHINSCCWEDTPPHPTQLMRFVGEWTAAYDQTPMPETESAFPDSRPLTDQRKAFLLQYVMSQMSMMEATPSDSLPYVDYGAPTLDFHGWFFWNFRMELDTYREWDYLRGVREGWIPKLDKGRSIQDQFGLTCNDFVEMAAPCTDGVIDPFPVISWYNETQCDAGYKPNLDILAIVDGSYTPPPQQTEGHSSSFGLSLCVFAVVAAFAVLVFRLRSLRRNTRRIAYVPIKNSIPITTARSPSDGPITAVA